MDELVKQVCERAGVNPEQAKKAIETVMTYLKEHGGDLLAKLQAAGGQEGGGLLGKLGGLFGKKE